GWFVGRSVCQLVFRFVRQLVFRLPGWCVGRLVCQLVFRLPFAIQRTFSGLRLFHLLKDCTRQGSCIAARATCQQQVDTLDADAVESALEVDAAAVAGAVAGYIDGGACPHAGADRRIERNAAAISIGRTPCSDAGCGCYRDVARGADLHAAAVADNCGRRYIEGTRELHVALGADDDAAIDDRRLVAGLEARGVD